jgi:DNA-binding NtrC family response regulator
MQLLVDYPWPGNVRELRNLVESMVVLSHGREILPEDLPRQIREGGSARWLPVPVPAARAQAASVTDGRELEFILRSLLELRLQVEDLKRRMEDGGLGTERDHRYIGEVVTPDPSLRSGQARLPRRPALVGSLPPRNAAPPANVVSIEPGTKMSDVERRVIEAALKETRGNRRRAAEMLGIGERTLYRKIKEYQVPEEAYAET